MSHKGPSHLCSFRFICMIVDSHLAFVNRHAKEISSSKYFVGVDIYFFDRGLFNRVTFVSKVCSPPLKKNLSNAYQM